MASSLREIDQLTWSAKPPISIDGCPKEKMAFEPLKSGVENKKIHGLGMGGCQGPSYKPKVFIGRRWAHTSRTPGLEADHIHLDRQHRRRSTRRRARKAPRGRGGGPGTRGAGRRGGRQPVSDLASAVALSFLIAVKDVL